jgi:hypothetical protein
MDGQIFPSEKHFFPRGKTFSQPSTILVVRTVFVSNFFPKSFSLGEKVFRREREKVFPHHTVDRQYFSLIKKTNFGATQKLPPKEVP